ncbi:hypothetical protein PUN28_001774 [Cardiocondyla obscurior]|uniref:Uncharacterized protein n=1 Tax=Cardiocondyla obscurior TaxID=286306 RepID=A0AAW2GR79_9HYME
MVKFVADSPFNIFHRTKRKTLKNFSNSHIIATANFDKSENYTSRALRLRANSKGDDCESKPIDILKARKNEDSYKSKLKTKAYEYWRNVLRNQWLLALQGIVIVTVILNMGTWIGHECKGDIVEDGLIVLWHTIIERLQETIIDMKAELQPCYHVEMDAQQKRRASLLRRKRIFMSV